MLDTPAFGATKPIGLPKPVRWALIVTVVMVALLFIVPPSSHFVPALLMGLLEKLRDPVLGQSLIKGISGRQWAIDWAPSPDEVDIAFSVRSPEGMSGLGLIWGLLWLRVLVLYQSAIFTFVMGLVAYMFAMPVARRLASPLFSIAVGLAVALIFYGISPVAHIGPAQISESGIISASLISSYAWTIPICLFTAALILSFRSFTGVEPQPGMFARFMTLLRDMTFCCLPLMALDFYYLSTLLQSFHSPDY